MGNLDVFYSILYSLPYLLLCLFCVSTNLHKSIRGRQFILPGVAVLYSIIVMLGIRTLENKLGIFIESHHEIYQFIANGSSEMLVARTVFIINALIVLVFLLLKSVLLLFVYRVWASDEVMFNTSGLVAYVQKSGTVPKRFAPKTPKKSKAKSKDKDKDSDNDAEKDKQWWILKPDNRQYKRLFWGFYLSFYLSSAVLFILSCVYPEWAIFQSIYYPVYGVLVLGETACFLSGLEALDPIAKKAEEKEQSKGLTPNFEALRKELRELFGDEQIGDELFPPSISPTFSSHLLDEYLSSKDLDAQIVGEYFSSLCSNGRGLDINYVQTSYRLMQGKSAVFYNPFYRDLTDYLTLPMMRQLMQYRKCLVVLGRDSAAEDVRRWLLDGMSDMTGTNHLWKVDVLTRDAVASDIGILKFSDIYDRKLQDTHRNFFSQVGFVLLIEPSRILATGQMGLSLLVGQCESEGKEMIYAVCDRNCDGLVDTLSHTLKTNITDVTATLRSKANCIYIYWAAGGESKHHCLLPDVSRYLGMGTKIHTLALKHHIRPTIWISDHCFPVADMKWIAGQYYDQICRAAGLESSQAVFNTVFGIEANIWHVEPAQKPCYVIEDEFKNIYEMTRMFSTRSLEEGCFNVISEHYLLRDYMVDNIKTMVFDPKAIPTIVPDFVRSERNIVLKLITMMANGPVRESWIEKELALAGISSRGDVLDITGQNAHLNLQHLLDHLFEKHCGVDGSGLRPEWHDELQQGSISHTPVRYCKISKDTVLDVYARKFRSAYFIAEDESGNQHHIGSRLYGHIFQAYLPGQFITSEGKYYQVQTMTSENGVVVRRAADHLARRSYYRQIRHISISNWLADTTMGSHRALIHRMGDVFQKIDIAYGYSDFTVKTEGYLVLDEPDDMFHAKQMEIGDIPERVYRHKSILRVVLHGVSREVRYTICLMLNEIFKTIYPEAWPYIAAVTALGDLDLGYLKNATFDVDYSDAGSAGGDGIIDFIEDSELDLGLLVSIERNLQRLLEMIAEVLIWHRQRLNAITQATYAKDDEDMPDTQVEPPEFMTDVEASEGLWTRFVRFVKRLFGRNAEEIDDLEQNDDADAKKREESLRIQKEKQTIFDEWYRDKCFLRYGAKDVFPDCLDIDGTIAYLSGFGFDKNGLQAVRESFAKKSK